MFTLTKKPGKDFKILNLTDTQVTYLDLKLNDYSRFTSMYGTIKELIEREQPDLITHSGDFSDFTNYDIYKITGDLLDSFDIPWTFCWGNHDNSDCTDIIDKQMHLMTDDRKNLLFEVGDTDGNGNFIVTVEEDGKPVEAIIMMDSHSWDSEVNSWPKLSANQLVWYAQQITKLREMGCEDSTIITHVPIYGYREAYEAAVREQGKVMTIEDGNNPDTWNEGYKDSFGVYREGICSTPAPEGAIDIISGLGHTKTYIAGHDHRNSFCINYRGVRLAYGLKTGNGCYSDEDLNGGTIIEVGSKGVKNIRHSFVDITKYTTEDNIKLLPQDVIDKLGKEVYYSVKGKPIWIP